MSEERRVGLSVVMPCRDVARWLPRCLGEVFAALPADGEVVAVDDGSTDGTGAILAEAASRRANMRFVAQGHRGVSAARNRALAECSGELVFFVDPDDGVETDFFAAMSDAMRRGGADYCVCAFKTRADGSEAFVDHRLKDRYEFSSNAEVLSGYLPRIFGYSFDDVREWYRGTPLFSRREFATVWRAAFRRDLIERAGVRFDETVEYGEDAMFNAEYLLAAKSMTYVDRPLYRMTERASGASRSIASDGARLCRNKLRLLAARNRLDALSGGRLAPLYAGTCVLSALEMLSAVVKGRAPRSDGMRLLRELLSDAMVLRALAGFPLSWRRPDVAAAVALLRLLAPRRS